MEKHRETCEEAAVALQKLCRAESSMKLIDYSFLVPYDRRWHFPPSLSVELLVWPDNPSLSRNIKSIEVLELGMKLSQNSC